MGISVIIPCLNEEETIVRVIERAYRLLDRYGEGEVIVADNGSHDQSVAKALSAKARVVHVTTKGYGSALRAGFAHATHDIVVMADADDTYHLDEADVLVDAIRDGADMVIGNRLTGVQIPGAMTRWSVIGTPLISLIGRCLFGARIGDFNGGMRACRRSIVLSLSLVATGMEFASEMIIKACLAGLKVEERPITLYCGPQGRRPHLRPLHDGWRHIRFMLWHAPQWLFLFPGSALFLIGGIVMIATLYSPITLYGITFESMTSIAGMFVMTSGLTILAAHSLAQAYGEKAGFGVKRSLHARHEWWIGGGAISLIIGIVMIAWLLYQWSHDGFTARDMRETLRILIPAGILTIVGVQSVFYGFLLGVFSIPLAKKIDSE